MIRIKIDDARDASVKIKTQPQSVVEIEKSEPIEINLTNCVIRPMPENYGLISWDGSTLTVS